MRSTRSAVTAAVLGAVAASLLSTTAANAATVPTAAPAGLMSSCSSLPPLPYAVHASAVTIRSKASASSTALGILYPSHKFTVTKTSGTWHYITDSTTGVKGWVSGTYVYRDVRMCLD